MKLKVIMTPELYKVADALFAYQKDGMVSYSKKTAALLHMDVAVADQMIQTLVDRKIISSAGQENGVWKFKVDQGTINRFNEASWEDIGKAQLMSVATEITFKNVQPPRQEYGMVTMSTEEMMAQMQKLQAMIMMKQQLEKTNNVQDGLPY